MTYWGLRRYANNQDIIWDAAKGCEHEWGEKLPPHHKGQVVDNKAVTVENKTGQNEASGQFCQRCHAWRGAHLLIKYIDLRQHQRWKTPPTPEMLGIVNVVKELNSHGPESIMLKQEIRSRYAEVTRGVVPHAKNEN